jgi:hypothetical protein
MADQPSFEKRIGRNCFCINPHVDGLGSACVFRLVGEQPDSYYVLLDVLPPAPTPFDQAIKLELPKLARVQLPRHLIKEYVAKAPHEPTTYFDGTLFLSAEECTVADDGEIVKVR